MNGEVIYFGEEEEEGENLISELFVSDILVRSDVFGYFTDIV